MKTILTALILVIGFLSNGFAQCPDSTTQIPQLHGVAVRGSASQDPSTLILTYRYSLGDDPSSIGCMQELQIDVTNLPGRATLSSSGLVDYPRYVVRNFGGNSGASLVPIGVPSLPSYNGIPSAWGAIVSGKGYISWGSALNEIDLPPGTQLGNFVLTSYGLPTIRSFTVIPVYNPPPVDEGQITAGSFDTLQTIEDTIKRVGLTIGPPAPFDSVKFLDTLKSYSTRSLSAGWIGTQSTVNKYNGLFDAIKTQIQLSNGEVARILLDSAIATAIRDSGSAITTEAYTLLRFNSAYLKKHLPTVTLPETLASGWNMVSVPVEVSDFRKTSLYPNANSNVFAYRAGGYTPKDTLSNGPGYWVKYNSGVSLAVTGLRLDSMYVKVNSGWNMIGSISAKLPKSQVRPDAGDTIVSNIFGFGPGGYTMTDTLKPGKGYWAKLNRSGGLTYGVSAAIIAPITQEQPPAAEGAPSIPTLLSPANGSTDQPLSITLSWNAADAATSYRLQVSTSSSLASTVLDQSGITGMSQLVAGLSYGTLYYWRVNASNSYGASNWSVIWNFTTQAAPPPPCDCCVMSAATLDQLTVTDAEGNSQRLMIRNANRPLRAFARDSEMPPMPVPGLFHARFQSGNFIESVKPSQGNTTLPILIKNAKFPLRVSWNIRPENNIQYWLITNKGSKVQLSGQSGSTSIPSASQGIITFQASSQPPPCQQ